MSVPTFQASTFSWHRRDGWAEASDLPTGAWASCDPLVGFHLVSDRTGAELGFRLYDILRDGEGEIEAWVFETPDGRFTATVFND